MIYPAKSSIRSKAMTHESAQIIKEAVNLFEKRFRTTDNLRVFFAPGRVNIIGEHIDYNGGVVLPCALTFGTYAIARDNGSDKIRLASANFEQFVEVETGRLVNEPAHDWANYPKGVVDVFQKAGYACGGFDMLVSGTIPSGAGLSSSASIELVTAEVITTLFSLNVSRIEMIKLCQKAENNFVKVNCGIMDQFAIGMGKKDNLVLINCNTLAYEHVPCNLKSYSLLIANTNKTRGLTDSKYNERRAECDKALALLRLHAGIDDLCSLSVAEFENLEKFIDDPVLKRRARHVISENERVKLAVSLLKKDESILKVGDLMNESHRSLREDYEVTGKELDTLVQAMRTIDGVAGARMTGAGFGGCAVAMVRNDCINQLKQQVTSDYTERIGYPPAFYDVAIGDGPGELDF